MFEKDYKTQGFSLIEVLVALSILLVFIVAFSVLFSNSISYIFTSGSRTETQYNIQEVAENMLQDSDVVSEVSVETFTVSGFEIKFSDYTGGQVLLDGDLVEMEGSYNSSSNSKAEILVTLFIPRGVTQ